MQLFEERAELAQVWAELVHAAKGRREFGERTRRIRGKLGQPLLATPLGSEDERTSATLLGKLPQLRFSHRPSAEDGTQPFLESGVERLSQARHPESTAPTAAQARGSSDARERKNAAARATPIQTPLRNRRLSWVRERPRWLRSPWAVGREAP
jgi:hypothetical protein